MPTIRLTMEMLVGRMVWWIFLWEKSSMSSYYVLGEKAIGRSGKVLVDFMIVVSQIGKF